MGIVVKNFLFSSKHITRSSYVWNMVGSMLMAFQSVILLIIIMRVLGLGYAGIYTVASAYAATMLTIGKFGVRSFQVSDTAHTYMFTDYHAFRYITSVAMLLAATMLVIVLMIQNDYQIEKAAVIVVMCVYKAVDSLEDVYHGMYQQKGRLDVAAKALTVRMGATIILFIVLLIFLHSLLIALSITTLATLLFFIFLNHSVMKNMKPENETRSSIKSILRLFLDCFPLFGGSFLSIYIMNAPKYAIDTILNDELQAIYGFLAMPAFVVMLFSGLIYNPILHQISALWENGQKKAFNVAVIRQVSLVAVITAGCIIIGWFLGIPVLSFIYGTDLSGYSIDLIILLAGGGLFAEAGFLVIVITILRMQRNIGIGYAIVAVMAYFLSPIMVGIYSLRGAAVINFCLMSLLFGLFLAFSICGIKRKSRNFISTAGE